MACPYIKKYTVNNNDYQMLSRVWKLPTGGDTSGKASKKMLFLFIIMINSLRVVVLCRQCLITKPLTSLVNYTSTQPLQIHVYMFLEGHSICSSTCCLVHEHIASVSWKYMNMVWWQCLFIRSSTMIVLTRTHVKGIREEANDSKTDSTLCKLL